MFKLLREFYVRQMVNPLSPGQIALWHGLVHQSNQLGWPSEFNMPNRTLEMLTGLSRTGIVKSRNVLKQSGLIDYTSNGTKAATYKVIQIYATTSNSVQARVQDGVQDRVPSRAQDRVPSGVPNSGAYLRQDKTKPDKTKNTPIPPEHVMSPEEEFTTEIWPVYPRKTGNFAEARDAYVTAIATGDTTKAEVLAKIAEYKAYLKLNGIGAGYTMTAGKWFTGQAWHNSYDTTKPENGKEAAPNERATKSYGGIEF